MITKYLAVHQQCKYRKESTAILEQDKDTQKGVKMVTRGAHMGG